MIKEIILNISFSIIEFIGSNILKKIEKTKINNKINNDLSNVLNRYRDSSLDCNQFNEFLKTYSFKKGFRNYLFLIHDGKGRKEYLKNFCNLIYEKCPTCEKREIKEFLQEIETIYANNLLQIINDDPKLSALYQMINISNRDIIEKISTDLKELKMFFKSLNSESQAINNKDIDQYHKIITDELSTVKFTGIYNAERKRNIKLNDFYVENTFSYYNGFSNKENRKIIQETNNVTLKNFFDLTNKLVLIGGAGLGKTTTLNYVFCNYEELYKSDIFKFKINLKDYSKEIGLDKMGIFWCLTKEFSKRTANGQINSKEIKKIITNLLSLGKCLIIFDALDEISSPQLRSVVREEISTFTSVYYLNRFIISTREVGYLNNQFDESFLHIRINSFNHNQIEKYCKNWFDKTDVGTKDFQTFWQEFNSEVKKAKCENLISNPIILVLALVIFYTESSLPNRKITFYQKCIDTFLIEREQKRFILDLEDQSKNILQMPTVLPKIANYKFNQTGDDYKFTHSELIKSIFEAIEVEKKDFINWISPVNSYANYLIDRAELIQEVDEDLFDFAHKTFYEYFLALYFVKEKEIEELTAHLDIWIGDANYDELARLIIEVVIQEQSQKKTNYIMDYLFEKLEYATDDYDGEPERYNYFYILANLYKDNLLPPKYYSRYNKLILYHSYMVFHYETSTFDLFNYEHEDNNIYDADKISNDFIEEVKKGNLYNIIQSLNNLNDKFIESLLKKIQEESNVKKVIELFANYRKIKYTTNYIQSHEFKENMKYFVDNNLKNINDNLDLYILLIILSFYCKGAIDDFRLDLLIKYEFNAVDSFELYKTSLILIRIIKIARTDYRYFLLLMILFVKCSKGHTNSIFHSLIVHNDLMLFDDEFDKEHNIKFVENIWSLLFINESYDYFEKKLEEMNLYNRLYENVYREMYQLYQLNNEEHKIDNLYNDDIISYIEKRSK